MKKTYKIEEKLTSEGTELRQPVAELETYEAECERMEEELRESEKRYKTIFENVSDVIIRLDKYGKVIDINGRVEECFGYKPEEVIGRNFASIGALRLKDLPEMVKLFSEAITGKRAPFILELEAKRKDGSPVLIEVNSKLVKRDGKAEGFVTIVRDITERKQAENELRKFKTISDKAGYGITIVDLGGNVSYVNTAFARMHGYTPDEVIGKHLSIFHPEHQMANVNRLIEKLKREGSYVAEEVGHKTKDNTEFTTLMNGTLVKDENGTPLFMAGTAVDITGREQAEEALRRAEQEKTAILDSMSEVVIFQDMEHRLIWANKVAGESVDLSPEQLLGRRCYEIWHQRSQPCVGCPVAKAREIGQPQASEMTTPDGRVWFIQGYPVRDANDDIAGFVESALDITERKEAEEALRESEEKLRKTFESVSDGISVIDLNGAITEANQRTLEMHGFSSKDKVVGKSAFELIAPCDHERIAKNMRKALKEGTVRSQEYTLLRADGSEFPAELSTSVLKDASGKVISHVTIARDITERKQAEEREKELQQELLLSSRLASIGELAAGVAHQLNNPLTGVLGFSQRLLRKSTDQEANQDLRRIYTEAERAAKVVQNLLTFARRREPKKEHSDINDILESALELRAYELKTSNIEVITNLAPNLPRVMLDFQQIQEVFLNIILNAEQVMTEAHSGGRLTIKTEEKKGYIRTTFTDDGPGIPAEHLDKIFDPFFSTRGGRGGTGLGLSVCHGIITEHGGRIYARSKPDRGTTFFVELPVNTGIAKS